MTEKLYDIDSNLKEFTANVISCEEKGENFVVLLDRTAFFPEAGGQGCDKGYIDNSAVLDVQIKDEIISHIVDKPLAVGTTVNCKLDWERRFDFMQQHSGEHIISGIANRLYGCENVGFHLSEDIVTLDFDIPLTKEQILKVEALANEAVFANKAINTYYPDEMTLETLNYRSKKELEGDIRIVEIEDTDICACCAPHVKLTGEIGLIKMLACEKLRGGIRIEIKCGRRALFDYNERFSNTAKIGDMLSVKYNETAEAVEKHLNNFNDIKGQITFLKKRVIEEKAKSFNPESEITAEFEDGLDIKELQLYSDALFKKTEGIRAVLSKNENGFGFAICGDAQKLDEFFAKFKSSFQVRGGGRNGMVQGTVIASKQELDEFFKVCRQLTKVYTYVILICILSK